jgi:predicted ATPase
VLDNCEHLIDACAHLADSLLARSPGLRIVATSREPLGIVGESLLDVPPLERDPAVRLFTDRAAAVSPGFALDEETLPLVADIVRRLDGLPLAIELAAARLRTLPLTEISRRLDDRFRLLTGGSRTALPRHRTLRAVVEWSWDLLTPAERVLAERFSLFPAGATPEAVADVCGGQRDTDDVLSSLVDKSLLQRVDAGARLRMLETIREYAAEKLAERAEVGEVRRRHAEYYADLMNEAAPRLLTRDQLTWLKAIEADRDNILAALRYWCDAQDAARAIALAVSVSSLALLLGNQADIAELIGQVVAVPGEADPDLRTIADALYAITLTIQGGQAGPAGDYGLPGLADRVEALGFERYPLAGLLRPAYAMFTQDSVRAGRYIEEARASQDEWLVAATWMMTGALADNNGDMDTLRSASARAVERFRAIGERWGLSSALRMAAGVRVLDGDLDGAAAAYAESGRLLTEMGSRDDESHRLLYLANIAARRGDPAAAREFYQTALAVAESDTSGMDVPLVSAGYAMFELMAGDIDLARSLTATAEQRVARLGTVHPARRHLAAVVAAAGLMIAGADEDLPVARERAATVYRAAVESEDMPLLASVGRGGSHRPADDTARGPAPGGPRLRCLRPGVRRRNSAEPGRGAGDPRPGHALRPPDVAAQRQREEHGQQAGAPGERPADLRADRPAKHQAAHGGHEVRERVHVHERLQPAGHRRRPHERVAAERQRHHQQEHHGLDRAGCPRRHADEHRDPRERQREADRERDRREQLQRVRLDPEPQYVAERDRDRAHDRVAGELREHRADQRHGAGDRQRPEPVEDALGDVGVHVLPDRDAAHRDRLAQQSRQQELQVGVL